MTMIVCPNCKHQELDGSLFCSECGAQLVFTTSNDDDNLVVEAKENTPRQNLKTAQPPAPKPSSTGNSIMLKLVVSNQSIPLAGQKEFTLGRMTEGQPILPDIDLSPYEGYAEGVSRLHAAIRVTDRGVMVVDLGSSNGTRINGQKIVPNVNYPLKDGDMLALGRIKLQISIRR
jgi:hypothetical protein